ncbi:MAG: thiamine phosphate synthase [Myxococcota bacterium]
MSRLRRARGIYPLADDDPARRHGPREIVEAALAGRVPALQLRLKHMGDADALALARWAGERVRGTGVLLFVNDRYDLADLAGADGVHLGREDLAPEEIPEEVRRRLLVGLSTHTLEQVREAVRRPVDCIGFGPVFATSSKRSETAPRGIARLREAVEHSSAPVVAIGGVGIDEVSAVSEAGAPLAAVISSVADADDPLRALRRLQATFG